MNMHMQHLKRNKVRKKVKKITIQYKLQDIKQEFFRICQ